MYDKCFLILRYLRDSWIEYVFFWVFIDKKNASIANRCALWSSNKCVDRTAWTTLIDVKEELKEFVKSLIKGKSDKIRRVRI